MKLDMFYVVVTFLDSFMQNDMHKMEILEDIDSKANAKLKTVMSSIDIGRVW